MIWFSWFAVDCGLVLLWAGWWVDVRGFLLGFCEFAAFWVCVVGAAVF